MAVVEVEKEVEEEEGSVTALMADMELLELFK